MHIKSVGGEDIHRLIKEGFSVSGNRRMRKTHALIASARRNHVVDGNTLVGIVNQRHREVSIRSVANSAVVAPRQCDLTLVIQQLNVQRQLETTLRHHHLRVINAKIRRNFIGFRNAIAKANFPRCANCFGLRAYFTLGAIPLFWLNVIRVHLCYQWEYFFSHGFSLICTDLVTCYPCPFVSSVEISFSYGFHRFSQIWLHVIRVHLWHQWEYFFSHGFHRFSQIWLHVIRVHLWHQWEYFFSHGFH